MSQGLYSVKIIYVCMKTVAVTKHTRNLLEEYAEENETMDETLLRLLESSEIPSQQDRTKTNINMDEVTFMKLMKVKAYPTESHSDTILSLLSQL